MDEKKIMIVKNRSASIVVYRIPEKNIRREFAPGEAKKIPYSELVDLSFQAGGRALMENFLQISSEDAIQDLNLHTEPEYHMSEQQIIDLLKNGSLDAFLDCLDFAPVGVMDLVKKYAIALPLNDSAKREALKKKTGFDVSKALEMNADDEAGEVKAPTATRRVQLESTSSRRTEGKYKVVSQTPDEG